MTGVKNGELTLVGKRPVKPSTVTELSRQRNHDKEANGEAEIGYIWFNEEAIAIYKGKYSGIHIRRIRTITSKSQGYNNNSDYLSRRYRDPRKVDGTFYR